MAVVQWRKLEERGTHGGISDIIAPLLSTPLPILTKEAQALKMDIIFERKEERGREGKNRKMSLHPLPPPKNPTPHLGDGISVLQSFYQELIYLLATSISIP